MTEVSDVVLAEFKNRMKISHSKEDDSLKRLLSSSYVALNEACGAFDWEDEQGKELVFERTRYAYNDTLEYFSDNFRTLINNLTLRLMVSEEGDDGG